MKPTRSLRSTSVATRVAAAMMSLSGLLATAGSATAQTPAWAVQCAQTTPNPWIKSGYCAAHQAWDKYYCKCDFEPKHPDVDLGDFGGRGDHGDTMDTDADSSDVK